MPTPVEHDLGSPTRHAFLLPVTCHDCLWAVDLTLPDRPWTDHEWTIVSSAVQQVTSEHYRAVHTWDANPAAAAAATVWHEARREAELIADIDQAMRENVDTGQVDPREVLQRLRARGWTLGR